MTYEINVKRNKEDLKKNKMIALKATKASKSSSEDEESEDTDDEKVAMLTRQVRKFLHKKKRFQGNNHKKFSRKSNSKKGESSKEKEIIYYECKKSGHMRSECFKL